MACTDKGGAGQDKKGNISCVSILVPSSNENGTTVNKDTQHSTDTVWNTEDTSSGTKTVPYGTLDSENIELSHMTKELLSNYQSRHKTSSIPILGHY